MTLSKQKRGGSFVGGLIPSSSRKTSARTDARTKECHSCRPLTKEFRRGEFQYRQMARQGNAAIYEQVWLGSAEPSPSYEVVRIRRREGFWIGNRFVNAAEIYPNSESWGVDGFTVTDKNKAWDKFFEISLEEPALRKGGEKWENRIGNSSATLST